MPSLADLAELAISGDQNGLLRGLTRLYDALGRAKQAQAVSSFNFLTDHPKKTVQEARWAGEIAAEMPEVSDTLVNILWEVCKWAQSQKTT
jgi:inosine/xanthosine triphosphate pyrophosphatase family protein